MNCFEIIFSPTGGTKKVAHVLANKLSDRSSCIDLTDQKTDFTSFSFSADDICLLAVPSFGGRVPAVAAERLRLLRGNGAKAVLVAVYGNRAYEDTLVELQDIAESAGFRSIAAVAAVAEHSIMRQFAAGRPDADDVRELEGFVETIRQRAESETIPPLAVPGNRPYKEWHSLPMHPKANHDCRSCGACAAVCPVGAIPPENPKNTDTSRCISCMRCISMCPSHARELNKLLLSGAVLKLQKVCSGRKPNEFI
ncbi:MAG: EFR1 family ferrodoxin [Agathobaculum sp.]|jgi:ferredoxin|uniref:EFR1 family ferrodoxin n=1 Tax=Agathobaculum sp. TaxID=2048138 RepID=UPI003D8B0B2C